MLSQQREVCEFWLSVYGLRDGWPLQVLLGVARSLPGLCHRRALAACFRPAEDQPDGNFGCFCNCLWRDWCYAAGTDALLLGYDEFDDRPSFYVDSLLEALWKDFYMFRRGILVPGRAAVRSKAISANAWPPLLYPQIEENITPSRVSDAAMRFFRSFVSEADVLSLLYHPSCMDSSATGAHRRARDVMPLPALSCTQVLDPELAVAKDITNLAILALNRLHGTPGLGVTVTQVHEKIHDMLLTKAQRLLLHIGFESDALQPAAALAQLLGCDLEAGCHSVSKASDCKLNADTADLLDRSGGVDPLSSLPPDVQRLVTFPKLLFPNGTSHLKGFRGISSQDQPE
jgi:hypothetical protein